MTVSLGSIPRAPEPQSKYSGQCLEHDISYSVQTRENLLAINVHNQLLPVPPTQGYALVPDSFPALRLYITSYTL